MNNQQVRSSVAQSRSVTGVVLIAVGILLLVAVIAAILSPYKDLPSVYLSIIVGIGVLAGVVGLYIAAARQFGLWLPAFLRVPEKKWDQNWRMAALSVIVIAFPLIMLLIERAMFH